MGGRPIRKGDGLADAARALGVGGQAGGLASDREDTSPDAGLGFVSGSTGRCDPADVRGESGDGGSEGWGLVGSRGVRNHGSGGHGAVVPILHCPRGGPYATPQGHRTMLLKARSVLGS